MKYRRRLSAKILKAWKALLIRQDRMVGSLAHRLHSHLNKITLEALTRWQHEAQYMHRMRILSINFTYRAQRQRCLDVIHAWRSRVLRRHHFHTVFVHLHKRHRLKTLRRLLQTLRISHKHPPILRRAILLVVGHMDVSRNRLLGGCVLRAWHVRSRCARQLVTSGGRLVTVHRKGRQSVYLQIWLDVVLVSKREREHLARQQHSAAHADALQVRDKGGEKLLQEIHAIQKTASEQVKHALSAAHRQVEESKLRAAEQVEHALAAADKQVAACELRAAAHLKHALAAVDKRVEDSELRAAQAIRVCKDEAAKDLVNCKEQALQVVRALEEKENELAALSGELEMREDAVNLMAHDLETARSDVILRDGWLENLGKEIDKKDSKLMSLEQMIQVYEKEFRDMQEARDKEAKLRERGLQDYVQAQGQGERLLRKPHESARALEPRLQLSARSARGSEKENEGPRI